MAIAQFVGGRLRAALVSLPMILVLAALTQVLEGYHFYRTFDDGMLAVVAALKPAADLDQPHASLATVMVSKVMFEAELGRKLPIDKVGLQGVLAAVASKRPSLIAIDVDAIPFGQVASRPAVQALPMFTSVEAMLKAGISVVLVSYVRHSEQEREEARKWRGQFCEAAADVKADEGKPTGKLYWASAWLQSEGRAMSVLRYYGPGQAPQLSNGEDRLLPLGLVVSAVGRMSDGQRQAALDQRVDYCANVASAHTAQHGEEHAEADDLPESFVNYFSNLPRLIEMESLESFRESEPELGGKAVVLGVRSFEGVDEHTTPLGQLPGAVMHTLVAASEPRPLYENHLFAFLLDILVGFLFVAFFLFLKAGQDHAAGTWHEAHAVIRCLAVVTPLLPLLALVGLVVVCAPLLAANGLWMNPLPIAVGLLVHLYAELTEPHAAHGHGASAPRITLGLVFRQWFGRFVETGRRWARVRQFSAVQRIDLLFRTSGQLLVLATLGFGFFMLFSHVLP